MWLSGKQLVGWILGVGLVCGLDYQDYQENQSVSAEVIEDTKQSAESIEEANQSAESIEETNQSAESVEGRNQSAEAIDSIEDSTKYPDPDPDPEGKKLKRPPKPVGALSDDDYLGHNDKNYNFNSQKTQVSFGAFRSGGSKKSRGSKVKTQIKPKPLPHQPAQDDLKGCGNPICVVIDRKPIRFSSICKYTKFACDNSRKNQMNFIQKGDCYDIIDNKGGAKDKPWTPPDLDLGDCSECKNDQYCGKPITVNIDLRNLLLGESSAFGGPSFNEQNPQEGRMVGVPIEFENVCALNKYFKSKENLNIKTQVIGIAIGSKRDIFPLEDNSNKCLWTEWFDHETPCNSDGDHEVHTDHLQSLEETYTGPLRICMPQEMGEKSQHEGGSEVTQVSAIDAKNGEALGVLPEPFEQVIEFSQIEIKCDDEKQTIPKLPPPFIFGEGEKGKSNKNATCLDYKIRYCCKSNKMYRPTSVNFFSSYIPPKLPIGPAKSEITVQSDGTLEKMNMTVFPCQGDAMGSSKTILVNFNQGKIGKKNKLMADINDEAQTVQVSGEYITRQMNGGMEIILELKMQSRHFGKIIIKSESGGVVTRTEIQTNKGTKAVSEITAGGGDAGGDAGGVAGDDAYNGDNRGGGDDGGKIIKTTITNKKGGKMEIDCHYNGKKIKTVGEVHIDDQKPSKVWEGLAALNQELNVEYFIESPPLATIFAECEWKDWISDAVPDEGRTGYEWELRKPTAKKRKYRKHVCGKLAESAHYIDAVTKETQTPWHELKVGGRPYEVYKLSPFHGYICNDANMPGNEKFCQDMKVRYCCGIKLRAQWSQWEEWTECTKSCGSGTRKRIKICKQSKQRKAGSGLSKIAYDDKCVGEESELKRKQASEQTENCNIQMCPVDFQWQSWSMWTSCSVSCSSGTKTRNRICSPAINGGGECPDKKTNKDLYHETKECTKTDCETFFEGPWCAWSTCSKTCGPGTQDRERKCYSNTTLQQVPNKHCANEKSHFHQPKKCKLSECPVDGGWSIWTAWTVCDQDCIDDPDDGEIDTKAKRTRRRHCNNPPTAYNGKKCKKDKKYKWLSHERAEMDSTECITERNKKPGDVVTRWCPENCLLTEWTEWSVCSQTCIVSSEGPNVRYEGAYKTGTSKLAKQGQNIEMQPQERPKVLPTRQRVRTIYKKQRHGGTCPQESFWQKGPTEGVVQQTEDCKICKEHCPEVGGTVMLELKKLPYPHPQHPNCVGYCPIDCTWENEKENSDCKAAIEKYFNETNYGKGKRKYAGNCFKSRVVAKLDQDRPRESGAFVKDLQGLIAKIRNAKNAKKAKKVARTQAQTLPSLAKLFQKYEDGEDGFEDLWLEIEGDLKDDLREIMNLLESETQKPAKVPVLDGLYGGKPCQRNFPDKKFLTVRKDGDPKYDKNTMTNGNPREYEERFDVCDIAVCGSISNEFEPVLGQKAKCEYFSWSVWGKWGKCDMKCGSPGNRFRKRHRTCMNDCKDVEAKGKCKPFHNNIYNRTYTDTDKTLCTPCPAEDYAQWTEWTEWKFGDTSACGSGMMTKKRQRHCTAGVDGQRNCKGKDTETMDFKKNPCPEKEKKGGNGEYNYGGESETGTEGGENPGTGEGADDDGGMVVDNNDGGNTYPGGEGQGGGHEGAGGDGAGGEGGEYPGTNEPADSNMGEYTPDNVDEAGHDYADDYADEYDTTESEDYN